MVSVADVEEAMRKHAACGQQVWADLSAVAQGTSPATTDTSPIEHHTEHHTEPTLGTSWWRATHVVHLPPGVTFFEVLVRGEGEVTVGLCEVVPALESGADELRRSPHDAGTQVPSEFVTIGVERLLAPLGNAEEIEEESGEFFLRRDSDRVALGLPRAVARSDHYGRKPLYFLKHPWPAGTFAQGGVKHARVAATAEQEADPEVRVRNGHVLEESGVFIEAFPRNPSTMLRGEARTFEEAEDAIWARWQRAVGCPAPGGEHEFEPRHYRNGAGFCKHCDLWASKVIDLASIGSVCVVCGIGTYWATIPQRAADGSLDERTSDLVCEAHVPGLDYWEVGDLLEAHAQGKGPAPDVSWFADYLPDGISVDQAALGDLRLAVNRGRRDLLDAAIAAAVGDNSPTDRTAPGERPELDSTT